MNNRCICWIFTYILLGILIFKGLTARHLYKSFGVKGLMTKWLHVSAISETYLGQFCSNDQLSLVI
jgi:hypothetical protein